MSMLTEFKNFAMRGNVVDMAVGIVIGGAFGKIVSSFVADVLMPPLGLLLGGMNFSSLAVTLKDAAEGADAVLLKYGVFIQTIVDFVILRHFPCRQGHELDEETGSRSTRSTSRAEQGRSAAHRNPRRTAREIDQGRKHRAGCSLCSLRPDVPCSKCMECHTAVTQGSAACRCRSDTAI
jgi:large conductance mechanosensitive channel protein